MRKNSLRLLIIHHLFTENIATTHTPIGSRANGNASPSFAVIRVIIQQPMQNNEKTFRFENPYSLFHKTVRLEINIRRIRNYDIKFFIWKRKLIFHDVKNKIWFYFRVNIHSHGPEIRAPTEKMKNLLTIKINQGAKPFQKARRINPAVMTMRPLQRPHSSYHIFNMIIKESL